MKRNLLALFVLLMTVCSVVSAQAARLPVLMYHHVADECPPERSNVVVTPDVLRTHINALTQAGYQPITFAEYAQHLNGTFSLPPKPVILSFDDGYSSNYDMLYPVLQELGVKATLFIVTSTVGLSPSYLPHFTWEQAKEMQDSGLVDIQSHSHSHLDLTTLSPGQMQYELRYARYLIEQKLGKPATALAYPYGANNQAIFSVAKQAGYQVQCNISEGVSDSSDGQEGPIRRLTAYGTWDGERLLRAIEQS